MAKRYVILDEFPDQHGNDDFILVGLKQIGFARGCPMLFGGTAERQDGSPDDKNFSLKVIQREVSEESENNILVNSIKRLNVYPNDFITYTSDSFDYTGRVSVSGEFRWIRKVSKGKLKAELSSKSKVTKDIFSQTLFQMTADDNIAPTDSEFDEYQTSNSLDSLYNYCIHIGVIQQEPVVV